MLNIFKSVLDAPKVKEIKNIFLKLGELNNIYEENKIENDEFAKKELYDMQCDLIKKNMKFVFVIMHLKLKMKVLKNL